MTLSTLGLNHTTAPLEVREKVVFEPGLLSDALRDLTSAGHATEAAILSTCNRTEVYFEGGDPKPVAEWLAEIHGLPAATLLPYVYALQRDKTVTHAFRVASGLDSMVLGEPQILGQMKHAVRSAEAAGTLGYVLNRLFQRTFAVAKDVRTQTDIGSASISMAAAADAVAHAERMIADQTAHFLRWLEGRSAVSTIDALSRQYDEVRVAELDRARRMLAAGAAPGGVLESLARGLTRKFLHAPLAALNAASDSERAELIAALTSVYHLDAADQNEWARQRLTA